MSGIRDDLTNDNLSIPLPLSGRSVLIKHVIHNKLLLYLRGHSLNVSMRNRNPRKLIGNYELAEKVF